MPCALEKKIGMHKQFDQLLSTVNLRRVCHLCSLFWSSHPLLVSDDKIDDKNVDDDADDDAMIMAKLMTMTIMTMTMM